MLYAIIPSTSKFECTVQLNLEMIALKLPPTVGVNTVSSFLLSYDRGEENIIHILVTNQVKETHVSEVCM